MTEQQHKSYLNVDLCVLTRKFDILYRITAVVII